MVISALYEKFIFCSIWSNTDWCLVFPREREVITMGLESIVDRMGKRRICSRLSLNPQSSPRQSRAREVAIQQQFRPPRPHFPRDEQSVGRWSGPLPMASGLVKRAVDRGDIFLVVENNVYVANVSWSGVWQEVTEQRLFFGWLRAELCRQEKLSQKTAR